MNRIDAKEARRLALCKAGLLKPAWTNLPSIRQKNEKAAHGIIKRFGYLQLDTVSIAGARSHVIVLLSRLKSLDPNLGESLLQPKKPLFEYWGHEASWIPMELYPYFGFRRKKFKTHPWWGDIISAYPKESKKLLRTIEKEGPLRSADMEGKGSSGWWDLKILKRIATAYWSSGHLAIRKRKNFIRTYDLTERVIPEKWRKLRVSQQDSLKALLLKALDGHGWAPTGLLCATWRLHKMNREVNAALDELREEGLILPCALIKKDKKKVQGWIQPQDLELRDRLKRVRPKTDQAVLLSPFDPILWDRKRVELLFDFHQILEIFKPASQRIYGYYCLPVLAGETLIARVDLKADKKNGQLFVLSIRYESTGKATPGSSTEQKALESAMGDYADALGLKQSLLGE